MQIKKLNNIIKAYGLVNSGICKKGDINSNGTFFRGFAVKTTSKNNLKVESANRAKYGELYKKLMQKFFKTPRLFGAATEVGSVISVRDGVAQVNRLYGVRAGEMLEVGMGSRKMQGMALSLESNSVSVVIFGNDSLLRQGDLVFRTGTIMNIPLSLQMFGRVVDPLGNAIDGGGNLAQSGRRKIDTKAIGIIPRQSVCEPMHTGVTAIDSITPVGCGQRELIIGDRKTGKTTIAMDAVLSQHRWSQYFCIYVAIGQKRSTVAQIVQFLKVKNALKHTIVVAANSSEAGTLQFLAPYSGCTLGE